MNEISYQIYVPSYNRSDCIMTKNILKDAIYVVRKSQKNDYLNAGLTDNDIWEVDDELIDSNIKVYDYIIRNSKEDVVVIADDDIKKFVYRLDFIQDINDSDIVVAEIERIAQMICDLGIGYACVDNNCIPYGYDREVAFKGIPGAMAIINKKCFTAKLDENVRYNFDIDIVLQELMNNRIIILQKYFNAQAYIDTNKGGDSSKRRRDQLDSLSNMKLKWGKYFSYNENNNKPHINVPR